MCDYLVTGGCGFIGSHLVAALVGADERVRVLDDLSTGRLSNLDGCREQVDVIEGDVRCRETVERAVQGISYVFHEAALVSVFDSVERPHVNHEVNVTGTLNLLTAAAGAGVKRLVFASSSAVYGNAPDLPKHEGMLPAPASPYAVAKLTGEHMLRVHAELYGLQTVSLRYFNVFGPRQDASSPYSGVISKFCRALRQDEAPTVFGDGGQTRDFVFVDDVVQANLLAMQSAAVGRGECFNIGTGGQTSLLHLLETLQQLTGRAPEPVFRAAREGDVRHSCADIARAGEVLVYTPRHTLQQGLVELLAHPG
mgnify:CR=1 FL=1